MTKLESLPCIYDCDEDVKCDHPKALPCYLHGARRNGRQTDSHSLPLSHSTRSD